MTTDHPRVAQPLQEIRMMYSYQEQLSAATKTNIESQLALISTLTAKTFESVEKVIGLNLNVARTSLEESAAAAQQLLAAKDAQEFFAVTAAQTQPTEKNLAYGRHLASIASSFQAECTKAAEAQFAEINRKVIALIEELSKNAPAGSDAAITLLKTTIGNVSAGYDQLSKTTKQAIETLEANINNAATQITQATAKASRAAKK
jgi:phasin family protein